MLVANVTARRRAVGLAMVWALVAALLAACTSGGDADVRLDFERYELANGLTVILRKDDRVPVAAVDLWYHVGPANEVAGRTGFAHLFEHMMFQGSGHVPADSHFALLEAVGASEVNAATSFDYTTYHEVVPSNALETALWLESDRMGFLLDTLDQAQLSNQQDVVRNERRENREAPPYALSDEASTQLLYPPGHPYHANIIGSHTDIQAAQLADVRDFFTRYYVPNNASLVIVGNIDVEATKQMVEKYFGTIPRGADVPELEVEPAPVTEERRMVVPDQVQLPRVSISWLTPAAYTPGDADADVTARILGGGKASRLHQALVLRDGIAQNVTAYQQSLRLGSVFEIQATAKPGHTADELEAAIQKELDTLAVEGPTAAELDAAKIGLRSDQLFSLEAPAAVASLLNRYEYLAGDADYLAADLQRYVDVEADNVREFAAALHSDTQVVVHTVPGVKVLPPDPPIPPVASESGAVDPAPRPPSAEPWRNTVPSPGPAPATTLPTAERFELANGLPVYVVASPGLPLAVARLVSRWGSGADPADQPGLASFTGGMLDEGTRTRDALAIAREAEALGASLATGAVTGDVSAVSVSALTAQMPQAMELMADVVRNPAFPPADLERVRGDTVVALRQQRDDASSIAAKAQSRAVYGADHPYGHRALGTEEAVAAFTQADVQRFHAAAYTPGTTALVLAGDLTVEQARTLAQDAFGDWTGDGGAPPVAGPAEPAPERVIVVDMPGATQTELILSEPAIPRTDPAFEKLQTMNAVLGGGASSRLFANLRERNGFAYGAYSGISPNRGPGPLSLSATVQAGSTGPAIAEMLKEVAAIRDAPVAAEELDRARQGLVQGLPAAFDNIGTMAGAFGSLYVLDLPPDHYQRLAGKYGEVTVADVQAAARSYLVPEQLKVIAVGDRAVIGPQLAQLGLGPVAYYTTDGVPTRP